MGCSLLGGGAGAVCADMMEKLPSGSECEVELRGRTTGMGRVRKSPVLGSALTPTILFPLLLSKKRGSAGLPMDGGGENRSPRRGTVTEGARLMLETSKSEERGRRTGSGPSGKTSSSSELSELISTTLLEAAVACELDGSAGRDRLRLFPVDGPASRDPDRGD